ncbi:aegerolysin type hemolysin [Hypomontagnella monticulosa]|nr:aegerolysin type hemolysin [Hypomontagnella monticulosa]
MAYAQWVYILIHNLCKSDLMIKNVVLNWGKFYKWDNKDDEISVGDMEGTVVKPGRSSDMASCGRSDASSGCEGSFEVFCSDTKVCRIYFSCPWGSKTNTFTVGGIDDDYMVQFQGANLDSGALGKVDVKIMSIPK